MSTFAIFYLRPDGWWVAGSGFESREEAEEAARVQLPDHVGWQVASESTDLYKLAKRGRVMSDVTPEEYADAQHRARQGGHFAPRDASLIARALLHADAEIALLRKQRDAYIARMTELEQAGEDFLRAYLDASVNDEEGLLAALDAREWTVMWISVDDKAQAFGRCLSSLAGAA